MTSKIAIPMAGSVGTWQCCQWLHKVLMQHVRLQSALSHHTAYTSRRLSNNVAAGDTTVDQEEVEKFGRMAGQWWDEQGEMRPLHAMNQLRVPLVCDGLAAVGALPAERRLSARPLSGLQLLDVGCGGGILAEPLARLGANVTGIDASEESIRVAELHAAGDLGLRTAGLPAPQYRCCTVEQLAETSGPRFDAVIASEVLEHVDNQQLFINTCCQLLKPGGSLFVTTISRTGCSWLTTILGAEYLARVLPVGTHDWNKFVTPEQLTAMLSANGLVVRLQHGMLYNPLTSWWRWVSSVQGSYAVHAVSTAR